MEKNSSSPESENFARAQRIAYLAAGFLQKTLTPGEQEELDRWVGESDENLLLFEKLIDEKRLRSMVDRISRTDSAAAFSRVQEAIRGRKSIVKRLLPYAAAACVFGLIAISILHIRGRRKFEPEQAAIADVAPGGNHALLTLSDGSTITLDNARLGKLAAQPGVVIEKEDSGKLSYRGETRQSVGTAYNTLSTPRGGQYRLQLPDGTQVWLNAGSSIRYPTVFTESDRTVEMTGEAYFEVVHDAKRPFRVKAGDQLLEDIGTSFDVNAYPDESGVASTLVEGSVKVMFGNRLVVLKPGERAVTDKSGHLTVATGMNTEDIVAWKEGLFSFHRQDINTIMRQVARWYNVDVRYDEMPRDHFNATIDRDVPVSKLLSLLEGTGRIHFRIQDRTIFVGK